MWIFLIVVAVFVIWVVGMYNGLIRARIEVKNAWSQIEVQLKRRYDLIPNLVEAVKDYMSYEQETLTKVIQARSTAMAAARGAGNVEQQAQAEGQLSGALRGLFAVFENYPDLKANQNVLSLQEELTSTENKIAFSRQYYNDRVTAFNVRIQSFPSNLVANMFNFQAEQFFDVPDAEKAAIAQPPKVNLR